MTPSTKIRMVSLVRSPARSRRAASRVEAGYRLSRSRRAGSQEGAGWGGVPRNGVEAMGRGFTLHDNVDGRINHPAQKFRVRPQNVAVTDTE